MDRADGRATQPRSPRVASTSCVPSNQVSNIAWAFAFYSCLDPPLAARIEARLQELEHLEGGPLAGIVADTRWKKVLHPNKRKAQFKSAAETVGSVEEQVGALGWV